MNNKIKDLMLLEEYENYELMPPPELSVRARKRLNRMFREFIGSSSIPYPQVDNCYERIRSFFIRKVNVLKHKIKIDK